MGFEPTTSRFMSILMNYQNLCKLIIDCVHYRKYRRATKLMTQEYHQLHMVYYIFQLFLRHSIKLKVFYSISVTCICLRLFKAKTSNVVCNVNAHILANLELGIVHYLEHKASYVLFVVRYMLSGVIHLKKLKYL